MSQETGFCGCISRSLTLWLSIKLDQWEAMARTQVKKRIEITFPSAPPPRVWQCLFLCLQQQLLPGGLSWWQLQSYLGSDSQPSLCPAVSRDVWSFSAVAENSGCFTIPCLFVTLMCPLLLRTVIGTHNKWVLGPKLEPRSLKLPKVWDWIIRKINVLQTQTLLVSSPSKL